ncbi:Acetyltransferase (GNAT) domain-containing protein [Arenibacter palladensis]|uniref:Acetyltransferase (GNAT) domain-containing protein n=1 Tax=Arenibacter palladensis TaxID=237373 RepID=A0A1M4XLR2_9FLAO|nr:GNAT family N-acetyltransferase [Arenibacter palladensis]SHE94371.1 Acetyltransferase (GNAT) domain-containing protein [Arenibacter palladensis]
MSLSIVPFESSYATRFKDLNVAWLEKYFYVEPMDTILLENCEANIIGKGGYIFFAQYNEEIVGCFAFLKVGDRTYELGKMAVDPNFQGLKIGQALLVFAIEHAKQNKWDKLILYSSTKLENALYIYRKYGFKEVEIEKNLPYARSDIKMELLLI